MPHPTAPPPSLRSGPSLARGPFRLVWIALVLLATTAGAAPPGEGECPVLGGGAGAGAAQGEDAAPRVLREGMQIDKQSLLALRELLPPEIWQHREAFFFEGMQMEIGPCHRRYPIPTAYGEASRLFAGRASLDRDGNLRDYKAGAPFAPDQIDAADPQAGARWAWNFEKRYRGAGHRGRFRISSLPSRAGGVLRYEGRFFVVQTAGRADLAASDYRTPDAKDMLWAAGGEFSSPFAARELAWRQFRSARSEQHWEEADDVFVYVPSMRKMRRSATPWVAGAFVPAFGAAGEPAGGGLPLAGSGGINPTAGLSIAASEDARVGLTGLFLRPNAWVWRLIGEQAVIAPLNGRESGYPQNPDRNYGNSGLSLASDRWDVRHAVVIEGALRKRGETIRTLTLYLDYQTQQPLYWITRTSGRRLVDIGLFAHRFSGDVSDAPSFPDATKPLVFEPVAAAFFDALAGAGGWLRESYDLVSLPYAEDEQRRLTTSDELQRGH